jgi:antitoxin (DNA-binding transcriptional repressor) of toxin-antitoxin stability system
MPAPTAKPLSTQAANCIEIYISTFEKNDHILRKLDHNSGVSEFSVHEAKAHFGELLRKAEAGETIQVTRHGKPIVEIRAIYQAAPPIKLGIFANEPFSISDGAFDPLTEEELADWYGG